jgi:hypothetical protein
MNEDTKQLFLSTLAPSVETSPKLDQFKPYPKANQGNIYRGRKGYAGLPIVSKNGWLLENRSDEIMDRALGFDWGHCGQGCAELAYTILANEFGIVYALAQYQNFKRDTIAYLPENDWTLTSEQITFFTSKNYHTKDFDVN